MGPAEATSDDLRDAVRRAIDEEQSAPGADRGHVTYIGEQWELALGASEPQSIESAIPYVPVDLEAHGVELSAQDLVVDVGCLGGFGMYDFARRRRARGLPVPRLLGVDVAPESIRVGEKLAPSWSDGAEVRFVETTAEKLGEPDRSVTLLIARSVLQYTQIDDALRELARVLSPGGHALIQWQEPSYYLWALRARPKDALYYAPKLTAHAWFRVFGRQLKHSRFRDVPMTRKQLSKLAGKYGLEPVWSLPVPMRPMALFRLR